MKRSASRRRNEVGLRLVRSLEEPSRDFAPFVELIARAGAPQ